MENINEFIELLDNFAGFVTVVVAITEFLKGSLFKGLSDFGAQLLSWGIAICVGFLASWISIGMFEEFHGQLQEFWWVLLITGFLGGLVANGVYDVKPIRALLKAILNLIPGINLLPDKK